MRRIYFYAMAILLSIGQACSPVKILNADAEPGFALKNYRTFDFYVQDSTLQSASPEYRHQIEIAQQEVKSQMSAGGLSQQRTNPDLLVNLGLVVEDKTQTRQTNFITDPPRYTGQRRYQWKTKELEVGKYKAGTLSMHLIDPAKNQLLWKADAMTVVPKNPDEIQDRIKQSVQALFKKLE